MTISLADFLGQFVSNPTLLITILLVLAVILVNGWTDAPNAIATCVSTRSMRPGSSVIMAAIFNFLGVLVMTMINATVAETIYKMVDFGGNPKTALIALCAALISIVLWATAAWAFGIPTSESHALIAGITGSAIALQGGLAGVNPSQWVKVIYGLAFSTVAGFGTGYLSTKIIELVCKRMDRRRTRKFFDGGQVAAAASMAFLHGAQDGQKFMSVFMLGVFLANGNASVTKFVVPFWLIVVVSAVMAIGTSIGGYKIIKSVGMGMVKLETYQGFAASIAASACLLISSLTGVPVSTTHTKTIAIMGVGASKRLSSVNWGIVREMVAAWILTFPGCGLIAYLMALLFMRIF